MVIHRQLGHVVGSGIRTLETFCFTFKTTVKGLTQIQMMRTCTFIFEKYTSDKLSHLVNRESNSFRPKYGIPPPNLNNN